MRYDEKTAQDQLLFSHRIQIINESEIHKIYALSNFNHL
jgi:hypothetical protein